MPLQSTTDDRRVGPIVQADVDGATKPVVAHGVVILSPSGGTGLEYETVAAGQTAQALGATGATGDYLSHIVISPGTTSPGNVIILDNATTIYTFAGGATSVSDLSPRIVPIGATSVSGAWKITTGANVTVAAFGDFT